jgi:sensor histidine kinase YesM
MKPIIINKVSWKTALSFAGCLVVFCAFFQICYDWMQQGELLPRVQWHQFGMSLLKNFFPMMIISLAACGIVWKTRLVSSLLLKLGVDLSLTLLVLIIVNLAFSFFTGMTVNWGGTVFCFILILLTMEMMTYFRRLQLTLRRDQLQQRELMQQRYELIKTKVNPHFLFNAFNQLYSMIDIAPERSQHFVLSLSRYYRFLMNVSEKEMILLSEERKSAVDYIDLMKQRHEDNIQVNIEGEPPATAMVVPLTLQILLENIAKHNIINAIHPMMMTITFSSQGFTVRNPICPRISEGRSGFGLKFLKGEYSLFGKEISIDQHDHLFSVFIPYIAL